MGRIRIRKKSFRIQNTGLEDTDINDFCFITQPTWK